MNAAEGPHAAYYRPAEVAQMLRCSEWWVKEQARRRRIPFCWIGGSYLFTDEHIAAIVRLFEVPPSAPGPPVGVSRTARPTAVSDVDTTPQLRARPPRRLRTNGSNKTAA